MVDGGRPTLPSNSIHIVALLTHSRSHSLVSAAVGAQVSKASVGAHEQHDYVGSHPLPAAEHG